MAPSITPWFVIVGDVAAASVIVDVRSAAAPLCDDAGLVLPTPPRCPSSLATTAGVANVGALDEIRLRCGTRLAAASTVPQRAPRP